MNRNYYWTNSREVILDKDAAGGNRRCCRQYSSVNRKQQKLHRYAADDSRWMTCSFILCTDRCWMLCVMTRRQWQLPHTASLLLPCLRNIHYSSSSSSSLQNPPVSGFFHFIYKHLVGLPGRGIGPFLGFYLHRTTQNAHVYLRYK